jgi:dihydroneopterin aldolase
MLWSSPRRTSEDDQGVPPTLIRIEGIRASGRHGANPGEQDEAQGFTVDVEAWLRTGQDRLDDTVDYREIVAAVQEVVAQSSFVLLETLAEVVAGGVYALGDAVAVTATVHKPAAASSMGVDDVSAEATVAGPQG